MTNNPEPLRVAVLASGTGSLLQAILNAQDNSYVVVGVFADKPCEAIDQARRHIPAPQTVQVVDFSLFGQARRPQWNSLLADSVAASSPDVVVSAGFMRILGTEFLDRFGGRTINTHPALLPNFPGAHAVRDALAAGVKVTGTTVHYVDAGVDTGPVIEQREVPVYPGDDESTLHERIKTVEREMIVDVLRGFRSLGTRARPGG
ncbi:phosphoribosylglycinamide formyltransferase [Corynebacterium argentoratense]|uniref:phosphoribosylglycinamide formyltransferase n=1 Tax=Corynebacterium argentoratense TaxID=42817 RepID=UPI003AF32124